MPCFLPLPAAARIHELASRAILFGAAFALTPAALLASGTQVGFKDAFATARGNAFVATADNPSAIYYNPAGLTQLQGQALSATAYVVGFDADYTSAASGVSTSMNRHDQLLPQVYYAFAPEGRRWALGVGFYAPFGLSTDWPATSGFRTFATRNEETYVTFNPAFAWRVSDSLSLGAGLTYNRLNVDLRRGIGLMPGDEFRFKADASDVGFNLGLRWQPAEQHAFGLSYQHHTSFDVSGTATAVPYASGEPASATFPFPEVLIAGYSYRPTPQWNIEANIDWTNWTRLNTVVISKASGPVSMPFNWRSSCFYELGVTRYLNGGWLVSAGYTYSENSVPDATWNPAVPDANRQFWCAGVGYARGSVRCMLTLQHATAPTRVIQGTLSAAGETADGAYGTSIDTLSLSLDYRF
ncbi:MAG: outer membrane protein transport protein [Opitutaceae bacterium]|nr:outer membrane protein transport protein [Opitutaceae bacterium]